MSKWKLREYILQNNNNFDKAKYTYFNRNTTF